MLRLSTHLPFVVAMAVVVVASNILVQFPVQGSVGGLALADILTWGAFTYPVRLSGHRSRQPPLRPGRRAPRGLRRLHAGGRLLDRRAAAAVFARPDRLWRDRRAAGADRRRLRRRVPRRATARRHRLQPAAAAELVARAGVRLAGRVGARHGDLLLGRLRIAVRLRRPGRCLRAGAGAAARRLRRRGLALDVLGDRRSLGEALDRRLRADPLPADRRPLEPAGRGLESPFFPTPSTGRSLSGACRRQTRGELCERARALNPGAG